MKITDSMIKQRCSDMIYRRGTEYFTEGRVHMRKRSETELSAAVDGEEIYNVYITFDENGIKSELCTCAYYETMHSACKHIVAALKQRMAELDAGIGIINENDKIATALCREFSTHGERKKIRASFELFVKPNKGGKPEFEMSVSLPDCGGRVQGLENFLDCYLTYREFKVDRSNVYSRREMYFPENEDMIIKIMAEVYQTRSAGVDLYRKASSKTSFGSAVMRRILPYMCGMDFKFIYDGITINNIRIKKEDPDILIDVEAFGKDIIMSLSESGFAITPNGEWFFYNDTIYNTTPAWRDYFMPIYRSMSDVNRTQITFKGDNAMLFVSFVLPKLRNRHGVVINGVDDIVINDEPEFVVYLDSDGNDITAVVSAKYGTVQFALPTNQEDRSGKIIIRKYDKEDRLLSMFSKFTRERSFYRLSGDGEIYSFITREIPILSKYAKIVMSERFKGIKIRDNFDITVNASYNKASDYLEIGFKSEFTGEEIREILKAIKRKEEYLHLSDGSYLNLKNNKKRDVLELLETVGVTAEDLINGYKELPKFELLRIEAAEGVIKDETIKEYLNEIRSLKPQIPNDLNGSLREYQKDGMAWFSELSRLGMGGILADDMGLGKTLQTICYIHGEKPDKPSLIVAPSTLVYNWQKEIERFFPNIKFLVISGSKETRSELIKTINDFEFVITSYPLLRRDIGIYKDIEFSYCIIDEAQYIKNRKTMNAISVKKIRAEHKFALTGTPIENSVMELWSIFDFVMPGYLKSAREFLERFGSLADSIEESEALRGIIRPFVLRRMKRDVLDELPEKIETTMFAELTREQKGIYQAYVLKAREEAERLLREGGTRMTILTDILRLRQICCHPYLFDDISNAESGKLELLSELVNDAKLAGHRILIFSQFRKMIDIIKARLENEGSECFVITGSHSAKERVEICERFNNGEGDAVLVSLKAGGTGINLTGADMVIHYDLWWNPAVTDQATDRAYRIGQTRAVQVIKLVSKGTIEEKMLEFDAKKRMLADDIIRVNNKTLGNLTDEEIMSLFDI